MKYAKMRQTESTFDLNLAPILDIIVAIVPLLLLSIAFVQVKMIDTTVPQVVAEAAARANEKSETKIELKIGHAGFAFAVEKDGHAGAPVTVANKDGAWDLEALNAAAFAIKEKNPNVFRVDLVPEKDVHLNELVKVMDHLRQSPGGRKVAFVDSANQHQVETELMFPDVLFANVIGE